MGRLRTALVIAGTLASAACASSTGGQGSVLSTPAVSTSPPDFPTSAATTAVQSSPPPSTPVAATSNPPVAVPAPKVCSTSDCTVLKSYDLGGGFTIVLHGNVSAYGGVGAAIIEFRQGGTPTYWRVFEGDTPSEMACDVAGPVRNCVVIDYVGAHAATAYPIVLVDQGLWVGEPVGTDTPGLHAGDLDGDNRIDVYGLQNNYEPDYATGKVAWQTWQRSTDGTAFRSTGCGPFVRRARPTPTAFLTGAC